MAWSRLLENSQNWKKSRNGLNKSSLPLPPCGGGEGWEGGIKMEEKCLCEPSEILIFPCSGGSNVGQIANQAGVRLTQDGMGKFFCLAGIGGHVSGMIESSKAGKMLVAIDGCSVACAKKTLEHAGFNIDEYIQVTDLGIEKNHDLDPISPDVDKVTAYLTPRILKRKGQI